MNIKIKNKYLDKNFNYNFNIVDDPMQKKNFLKKGSFIKFFCKKFIIV